MIDEPLHVAGRYNGPDGSGNGGYVSGLVAALVDRPIGGVGAMVTLRVPPPLERPLTVARDAADAVRVLDGSALVAEAVRTRISVDAVPPVAYADALGAEPAYVGLLQHPFPHCFTCGTQRAPAGSPEGGLSLRPGSLEPGRTACTWTPDRTLTTDDGRVRPEFVWSALDCPGGWTADIVGRPMVLGRMAARVDTVPEVGETCVVVGRRLATEGRKTWTATTAYGEDGRELGRAHATWLTITG